MRDIGEIIDDLAAEQVSLDELVRSFDDDDWHAATPAEGWTNRHQIAHLAFFDATAALALTNPQAFARHQQRAAQDPDTYRVEVLQPLLALTSPQLLEHWRKSCKTLLLALHSAAPVARYPWYGPSMSLASMATARLMETWAHGQDVADSAEIDRPATARLVHIARLACLARPYSFAKAGLPPPKTDVTVKLALPSKEWWRFGDSSSPDSITGPIDDFCLVLTRRRHVADTALEVTGPIAATWMAVGQAFAGPPGPGRYPGQFHRHPPA
ncbi:TIGR03084 family metal-binding protein [Williamsia sp.]|uniref:TIGR03084 family metal-binding protein n=1 Tax=Williamsia sp. TaxID=1872085 RepID=UPI002F92EF8D